MGRFVIAAHKPKPGQAEGLTAAVEKHFRVLCSENLLLRRKQALCVLAMARLLKCSIGSLKRRSQGSPQALLFKPFGVNSPGFRLYSARES